MASAMADCKTFGVTGVPQRCFLVAYTGHVVMRLSFIG